MEITSLSQLDLSKSYTYADYVRWKFKERVELFKGKVFKMSPAPARIHQDVLRNINRIFDRFFIISECKVYFAPFDVRLPNRNVPPTGIFSGLYCRTAFILVRNQLRKGK